MLLSFFLQKVLSSHSRPLLCLQRWFQINQWTPTYYIYALVTSFLLILVSLLHECAVSSQNRQAICYISENRLTVLSLNNLVHNTHKVENENFFCPTVTKIYLLTSLLDLILHFKNWRWIMSNDSNSFLQVSLGNHLLLNECLLTLDYSSLN